MSRFIDYGKIGQFRNVKKFIKYDKYIATGTEKIHGTNAAVCYSEQGRFWIQSRNNIITIEKDNAQCATIAYQNKDCWMKIIKSLVLEYDINLKNKIISVFFEWCGGNIQKNSCVSGLEKMAIIFKHFKVSPLNVEIDNNGNELGCIWIETKIGEKWVDNIESRIYNICNFPSVQVDIDFSNPNNALNEISKLVSDVESNSGVSKFFNKNNIGEGWVWTFVDKYGDLKRFKTKGDKHSKSKVKKLEPVDMKTEQVKIDFANYSTPSWRLEQAWQTVFGIENSIMEPDIKGLGTFLRAVMADVYKEETDILDKMGLTKKQVNPFIAKISRNWFIKELHKN